MSSTKPPLDMSENDELFTVFRGRPLPQPAYLAGYSALINHLDLAVPLHHQMVAISPKNARRREDGWNLLSKSYKPSNTIVDHLIFALKYEGVNLLTLKETFFSVEATELVEAAMRKPNSGYVRRLNFFYEWLTGDSLDIPDVKAGAYVDALDERFQYTAAKSVNSKRFRVRDNLPGTPDFCPLVFRTRKLDEFIEFDFSARAKEIVNSAPRDLIARAAAFLLLSDSKASFAIEGENPPKNRVARWGQVIGKAGQISLSVEQLERLQKELIGDDRFVKTGLRTEGGFVGRHDITGQPEPEHISANPEDLRDLIEGLVSFSAIANRDFYHPVLAAASISFGFVYIHPFEDGNGRIHRFLMHHVLSEMKYTPEQIVFPISTAILDDISRYKDVLERVSHSIIDFIDWKPTVKGNVEVMNETVDLYRYFDATSHSEFLFKCISLAVEKDLPNELAFLQHRDDFHRAVTDIVDMGERKLDLLLKFLRQNHGYLSKRAMKGEFDLLTAAEIADIEAIYADLFLRQNVGQGDLFPQL